MLQTPIVGLISDFCDYSVPKNEILDLSKLTAFTDKIVTANEILNFVYERVKNIVGEKGKNAGKQHFLLFFQQCLQKSSSLGR